MLMNGGDSMCAVEIRLTVTKSCRLAVSNMAAALAAILVVVTFAVTTSFTSSRSYNNVTYLKAIDCGVRDLALTFASDHGFDSYRSQLIDALRLKDLCGAHAEGGKRRRPETKNGLHRFDDSCTMENETNQFCLYVKSPSTDASSDRQMESSGYEYASLKDALRAARSMNDGRTRIIRLSAGVHFLNETIQLGSNDSNVIIRGNEDGSSWISGGFPLENVSWTPSPEDPNVLVANLRAPEYDALWKTLPRYNPSLLSIEPHRRFVLARFPNADPETAQWGYASEDQAKWSLPSSYVREWVKPPTVSIPTTTFVDLTVDGNPTGFVKNDSTMREYNTFTVGTPCGPWADASESSYWCSNRSAGGWAEVDAEAAQTGDFGVPAGLVYADETRIAHFANWSNATNGLIHAWHSQSWFTSTFTIETHESPRLMFSGGGQQGGRNWCRCDQCAYAAAWCGQHSNQTNDTRLISGNWFVENIRDELDAPGEFWFDHEQRMLYLYPNSTSPPSSLVVPLLSSLVEVTGTDRGRPVVNVTIERVGFRDTRRTELETMTAPSGGDWSMYRGGALFIENAENVTISNSTFSRLDGNAVFLSRYTRDVSVLESEFAWLGMSGVAFWGDTNLWDATSGNQPRRTRIESNFFRELGIYVKQSSAVGMAKSPQTFIRGNVMINMPRAAINFNDGLGGGSSVTGNLIFNTCRESGDHGAINTWDRMPFLTKIGNGVDPSFKPLANTIAENFIFANYGSSQAVDNDDGSSWYDIHSNAFYWADGFKMDYGGHDSTFHENVVVGVPYDGQAAVNLGSFFPGHAHNVVNNTFFISVGAHNAGSGCGDPSCLSSIAADVTTLNHAVTIDTCDGSDGTSPPTMHSNRYFSQDANASIRCGYGGKEVPLTVAQRTYPHLFQNSTASPLPSMPSYVVDALASVLGLHTTSSRHTTVH